jgi:site-specific DNA-methyltransferase (adenine-specific)
MKLFKGDCLEIMKTFEDNIVDTIVTDPPYGLEFMGKDWDKGVPGIAFWKEMLRVAKPGAFLLAMGSTRTYHRLVCAIEDAGWEIRDTVAWVHSEGFPKNYNIARGMESKFQKGSSSWNTWKEMREEQNGRKEEPLKPLEVILTHPEALKWKGWGTCLKPAFEPICVAMKPREGSYVNNALKYNVAGLNIEGTSIEHDEDIEKIIHNWPERGSVGDFGINKKEQLVRMYKPEGRFPANFIHDGSEEVVSLFPNGQDRFFYCAKPSKRERNAGLDHLEDKSYRINKPPNWEEEVVPKKNKNRHPTLKPLALMEYLVRLTATPDGGVVFDPFMGSGTTGIACVNEGRDFIGIEKEKEYYEIAKARIDYFKKKKEARKENE